MLATLADRAGITVSTVDSALGRWTHAAWRPVAGEPLAGLVEHVWYFEGTLAHAWETVFPNGMLELIVQLDEPHRPAGGAERYPPLALTGMQTGPLTVEAPPGRCRVLGVRVYPAGAYALLRESFAPAVGATLDLSDVAGRSARELGERCEAARDAPGRVAAAIDWTAARLGRARELAPYVAYAAARIERAGGDAAIASLQRELGVSGKRFVVDFREQIGIAPKRYARIVRFRRTLELIDARAGTLADIAGIAGYYDQAHMSAEFSAHAGRSPSAYLAALRFPGSSSLAADPP
jgi:AraC-like DNA-binding protein